MFLEKQIARKCKIRVHRRSRGTQQVQHPLLLPHMSGTHSRSICGLDTSLPMMALMIRSITYIYMHSILPRVVAVCPLLEAGCKPLVGIVPLHSHLVEKSSHQNMGNTTFCLVSAVSKMLGDTNKAIPIIIFVSHYRSMAKPISQSGEKKKNLRKKKHIKM